MAESLPAVPGYELLGEHGRGGTGVVYKARRATPPARGLHSAYGVGVLKGWSDSGARPEFDVVTGVSAGALMSTFAFLGPQYDDFLRANLVGTRRQDFLRLRPLTGLALHGALFSA